MEALQNQELEHEDAASGLAPGGILSFLDVDAFEQGTKHLPVDDGVQTFQRVACAREAGIAILKIEQAVLHRGSTLKCVVDRIRQIIP